MNVELTVAYSIQEEVGELGNYVGLSVICDTLGVYENDAVAYFGAFPGDGREVQLLVRSVDGKVRRFGRPMSKAEGFNLDSAVACC